MECYQARLDSFSKSKRVKNLTLTTSSNIKWLHPSSYNATPHTLAEAGFYFDPSWEDRDNVTCFICKKSLSDWSEEDNPFDIHWSKCKTTCVWAQVRCGLMEDVDQDGRYVFSSNARLPTGKAMEKARVGTFTTNKWWPHTKNHGANSKKMAQAGFVYTPQTVGDDTASCLYCNISLSGWDPEDDPMEEHRKREKRSGRPCPFFSSKTVGGDEPTSKSSTSTVSKPKVVKQMPESDDELELAPPPPPKKNKSASGSKKPSAVDEAAKGKRATRGASRAGSVIAEVTTDGDGPEKAAKGKRKGKKAAGKKEDVIEEEAEKEQAVPIKKPKRGRPKKTVIEDELEPAEPVGNEVAVVDLLTDDEDPVRPLSPPADPEMGRSPTQPPLPNTNSDASTFFPPLALFPIPHIASLSDSEQDMTVEQWIRQEIAVQYEQLKGDGERRIEEFRGRAEEAPWSRLKADLDKAMRIQLDDLPPLTFLPFTHFADELVAMTGARVDEISRRFESDLSMMAERYHFYECQHDHDWQ